MIRVPAWFYVFSGAVLILSGVLQLLLRPREDRGWRLLAAGPLFSLLSIGLGVLVVAYGLMGR